VAQGGSRDLGADPSGIAECQGEPRCPLDQVLISTYVAFRSRSR
jgi:hypothetical protein